MGTAESAKSAGNVGNNYMRPKLMLEKAMIAGPNMRESLNPLPGYGFTAECECLYNLFLGSRFCAEVKGRGSLLYVDWSVSESSDVPVCEGIARTRTKRYALVNQSGKTIKCPFNFCNNSSCLRIFLSIHNANLLVSRSSGTYYFTGPLDGNRRALQWPLARDQK